MERFSWHFMKVSVMEVELFCAFIVCVDEDRCRTDYLRCGDRASKHVL